MSYENTFSEIVNNTPGGVTIYTLDIWDILGAINSRPGYPFFAKNIPDVYYNDDGYERNRRNPRKFLVWRVKD